MIFYSEELVKISDLAESEKKIAERSYYPDGTYAYSVIGPSVIYFPFPV